jgi:hypothetical protein
MKDIWGTRIQQVLYSVFISPETLFAILLFAVYLSGLYDFTQVKVLLFESDDLVKWITLGLPLILFVSALALQKAILQPESNNKILYKWPDYDEYRLATIVGLVFCLLPIVPTFFSWRFKDYFRANDIGFYYVLLLGISLISLVSQYFASQRVIRVLQENVKEKS